jgi:hypothetical protein
LTNINDLQVISVVSLSLSKGHTNVHRPVPLLHVVCRKEVQHAGEFQEKVVLETKHGRRPDDGGFGENASCHMLRAALDIMSDGFRAFF